MRLQDIANDINKAAYMLQEAAYKLSDKGRDLQTVSEQVRNEWMDPGALVVVIAEVEMVNAVVAAAVEEAVKVMRRLPYEGEVQYG